MKHFLKFLLFILIAVIGYGAWIYQSMPTQITPLPYSFKQIELDGINSAEDAHVLIVGDRMGVSLNPYLEMINQQLAPKLQEPLRIANWSRNGEGLHRTLEKLKNLKNFPSIIVYLGGGQEFEERRFYLEQSAPILKNFQRYQDKKILSAIMTLPVLSRFLYQPHPRVVFEDFNPETKEFSAQDLQLRVSTTLQIYRFEMQELIRLVKNKKSQLVLSTQPINLDIAPKKICENAQTPTQRMEQREIIELLKENRSKEAYARSKDLVENTLGNALNFYLKGQSAKAMGKFQEALGNLQLAIIFDCEQSRPTPLINEMLGQYAKKEDLFFIDFNWMLNQNYGRDELFLGDIYPQNIYYQRFMNQLIKIISQALAI